LVQSWRKTESKFKLTETLFLKSQKFEMPDTQFERTVRDKIDYKTHLEKEND